MNAPTAPFDADRLILSLKKTPVILNALLNSVTADTARQMKDGPDGWAVVETVCHLVDFGAVSRRRIEQILSADVPVLVGFDHAALHRDRDHINRDLRAELQTLIEDRRQIISTLSALSPDQWSRRGSHPNFGEMSLTTYANFIAAHDVNHLDQIARSLLLSPTLL